MDRRYASVVALAVVGTALTAWTLGAIVLGLGRHEGTWERMQPGVGYQEFELGTFGTRYVASTVSPDGRLAAVVFQDGQINVWERNSSGAPGWTLRAEPHYPRNGNCGPPMCGIRFMPNGSLVHWNGLDLRVYGGNGSLVWSHRAGNASQGIREVEVLRNGSALIAGQFGHAEVFELVGNASTSYPTSDGWMLAASASGDLVAAGHVIVQFFDRTGRLVAEVLRNADVQLSADGRVAVVGDGTGELEGTLVVLDLSNGTAAQREIRMPNMADIRGHYPNEPNRIFMSPNGRFVAVKAEEWLSACGGFDCVVSGTSYVRVVDLQDPSRDLGFGSRWQSEIALLDDGSAVGIQGFTRTYGPWIARLVVADVGSTPPHKTLERTGIFYDQSSPAADVGVGMGLLGLSTAVLAMALSRRRLNPPGPRV